MIDRRRTIQLTYRILSLARAEQLTLLSAAVAFYAFLSLVPLSLLSLGVAASIGGEPLAARVAAVSEDVLTPTARQILAETLLDETGRQGATAIGAVGLIWGASRVLHGLDQMFSAVYGTVRSSSLLDTLWDSMIVLVAATLGFSAVTVLEVAVEFVPGFSVGLLGPVFVLISLLAAFFPMYVVFPDVPVSLREAAPGAIIATIGWFALGQVFSLYTAFVGGFSVYGVLGAVLLVLIWLYLGAAIVVFGVVVNAVLAGIDVDRQLQSHGPRQVSTEAMSEDATGADERDGPARGASEPQSRSRSRQREGSRTRDRADDPAALREELRQLEDRLESFETSVEDRTVRRQSLEADLKRYVRRRVRRGHAHGWGPYLVLLYGTAMTLGAFYFLEGPWAVLAMLVVWTSTLGVYVLMVLFGAGISALGLPGRLRNRISEWRS
ncbi:YihY/virulence factor BrkB family protein [Natronosalvus caseinilyticus]|uniref:YihY/virulence factor BrkB family protein n=1 Tax=Natronosalvus caseinilyticus TaxID=2953747 RepID=UPI0028AAD464|nr:YhjD/YihY/BrkB family envelope integrity protein [Natronosalvus caseinilyticus]